MLTRDQATRIADSIVSVERQRSADIQNAKARRVPIWLQSPHLSLLEPRHQDALVRQAERLLRASVGYWLCLLAWFSCIALCWYFGRIAGPLLFPAFALVPILGVLIIRALFVRRELARLLSTPQGAGQTP